jgi:TonB family protein
MDGNRFLPQNLMPYGGPSQNRESWKQQLKAFIITFGTSALIGLFANWLAPNEQIYPTDSAFDKKVEPIKIFMEDIKELIKPDAGGSKKSTAPIENSINNSMPTQITTVNDIPTIDIVVPDDGLDNDLNELIDEMNTLMGSDGNNTLDGLTANGLGTGGFGDGNGNGIGNGNKDGINVIEIPDETVFVAYDKEPGVDMGKLSRSIIYPQIAKKAGLEGRVVVRVLVGPDGEVLRADVMNGKEIFHISALEAVKAADFQPAILDGRPVISWIRIPITYKLD